MRSIPVWCGGVVGMLVFLCPAIAQETQTSIEAPVAVEVADAAPDAGARVECAELFRGARDYRLLATNKTSTMELEMNAAAAGGYRLEGLMGGGTAFGGSEVVVVLCRPDGAEETAAFEYKLLATKKTSTMQQELQAAGEQGFEYVGQTVFETAFGGREVVVILERRTESGEPAELWDYKLLATKKTSTMEKELAAAGRDGYAFVGVTVSPTFIGGDEVVAILRRPRPGE